MSFDPACYDLAVRFLADEPGQDTEQRRRELAWLIQSTIETYLTCEFETVELDPATGAPAEPVEGQA